MLNSPEQPISPIKEIPHDLKPLVKHIENSEHHEKLGGSEVYDLAISKGWVQEGDVVYDLGCGDGSQSPKLSKAVGHGKIFGIDIAPSLIESAKKTASNLNNVEVYQMDARKIESPLNYNSADKVFISDMLWMLPKESALRIINEAISLAKPRGKIIASMDAKDFNIAVAREYEEPSQVIGGIENDQSEYSDGLIGSMFTEDEIRKILGDKCSLDITHLSQRSIDPENIRGVPSQLIDKTERYLVLATKK